MLYLCSALNLTSPLIATSAHPDVQLSSSGSGRWCGMSSLMRGGRAQVMIRLVENMVEIFNFSVALFAHTLSVPVKYLIYKCKAKIFMCH